MRKKHNIIVVIDCLDMTNGVSITTMELVRHWKNYDPDSRITFYGSGDDPREDRGSGNVMVKYVRGRLRLPLAGYEDQYISFPLKQLHTQLKQGKYDLIHVMTPGPMAIYALFYARKHKIPLIISHHTTVETFSSYGPGFLKHVYAFFVRNAYRYFYPKGNAVICHSQAAAREALQLSRSSVVYAPMGVDIPIEDPKELVLEKVAARERVNERWDLNPEKPLLLGVGRVAKEKSVHEVAEAGKGIDANIVYVGGGPDLDFIKKQPHIKTTGFLHGQDLTDMYLAADLLINASRTETCGKVFLESLALGTPIMVSSTGQHNSHLCPDSPAIIRHDSVEDFHEKINRFLNTDTRAFHGEALKAVSHHSWQKIRKHHFDPYAKLLKIQRPRDEK